MVKIGENAEGCKNVMKQDDSSNSLQNDICHFTDILHSGCFGHGKFHAEGLFNGYNQINMLQGIPILNICGSGGIGDGNCVIIKYGTKNIIQLVEYFFSCHNNLLVCLQQTQRVVSTFSAN